MPVTIPVAKAWAASHQRLPSQRGLDAWRMEGKGCDGPSRPAHHIVAFELSTSPISHSCRDRIQLRRLKRVVIIKLTTLQTQSAPTLPEKAEGGGGGWIRPPAIPPEHQTSAPANSHLSLLPRTPFHPSVATACHSDQASQYPSLPLLRSVSDRRTAASLSQARRWGEIPLSPSPNRRR